MNGDLGPRFVFDNFGVSKSNYGNPWLLFFFPLGSLRYFLHQYLGIVITLLEDYVTIMFTRALGRTASSFANHSRGAGWTYSAVLSRATSAATGSALPNATTYPCSPITMGLLATGRRFKSSRRKLKNQEEEKIIDGKFQCHLACVDLV